jgi:hypothetical protein
MQLRAIEFTKKLKQLDEISMKPTRLAQSASGINAMAGVEFEIILPVSSGTNSMEIDAVRVSSINDIKEFFIRSNPNSIESHINTLKETYKEWLDEKLDEEWESDGESIINDSLGTDDNIHQLMDAFLTDYMRYSDEEKKVVFSKADEHRTIYHSLSKLRDAVDAGGALTDYIEALDHAQDEISQISSEIFSKKGKDKNGIYDKIYKKWRTEQESKAIYSEETMLQDHLGVFDTRDYFDYYGTDITWPKDENKVSEMIKSFSAAVKKEVNYSSRHGGKRVAGQYTAEPDGSLKPGPGQTGMEFVSPTMPLSEMISDIRSVVQWAKNNNCVTGSKYGTGLHMNVSVPGMSGNERGVESIDYVKLAIMLGDEHILQRFGRSLSEWATSAHAKVRYSADTQSYNTKWTDEIMNYLRSGATKLASDFIHHPVTTKYTSINVRESDKNGDSWIEFRSPGGDWINYDTEDLIATINRFAVALHAAVNPEEHRQEYLKKFYKLMRGSDSGIDPEYESFYYRMMVGDIDRAAAKEFISRLAGVRKNEKGVVVPGSRYSGQPVVGASLTGNWIIATDDRKKVVDVLLGVGNEIDAKKAYNEWLKKNPRYSVTELRLIPEKKIKTQQEITETEIITEMATPILYHYTSIRSALKILTDKEFKLSSIAGNKSEEILAPAGHNYFMSLTRSKVGDYHRYAGSSAVMFVLDGNVLSQRYKVKPVDYWERSWIHSPDRTSESEDRLFSKNSSISLDSVKEIHILSTSTDVGAILRKIMIESKKLGISTYFYNDLSAWRLQDTRKSLSPKDAISHLSGQEKNSYQPRPARGIQSPTEEEPYGKSDLYNWIELLMKEPGQQLSKSADKLRYNMRYYGDFTTQLRNSMSNARKPGSSEYPVLVNLVNIMKKEKLTVDTLQGHLAKKWGSKK